MSPKSVGIPTETKDRERRVVLTPSAVGDVVDAGHTVRVQRGAGDGAGFPDERYVEVGAEIVPDAAAVWACDVVVKVKEPQKAEYDLLRPDQTLFGFLHLAAEPDVTRALVEAGTAAYAFETLTERGSLPILAPMSEVAGRMAAIAGAYYLSSREGGSGQLAGGAAGAPPARVAIIGLGVAGTMAARGATGLDAHVTGVDVDLRRLYDARMEGSIHATLASERRAVTELVAECDLVIGAALVPAARAPVVVTEEAVKGMRPGSVIVDIAIDQGGCVATSRPTSLSDPIYEEHGVIHYCVTNIPGQFPRTSSAALSAAVAPRLLRLLADPEDPRLEGAANVLGGEIVHPVVAEAAAAF